MNQQQRAVVQQAIEVLEKARSRITVAGGIGWELEAQRYVNAIAALRQLLKQPEPVQEPVYLVEDDFGLFRITTKGDWNFYNFTFPGVKKTLIANATPPAQPAPVQETVELVQIEHWRQDTMEYGHWEKTREMPRHIAERLLHHFDQASIITAAPTQGETK